MEPIEIHVRDAEARIVARFQLTDDGEYTLGRDQGSVEIPLVDPSVSRRHAAIRLAARRLFVTDRGSTNGTRLGEAVVDTHWYEWLPGVTLHVGIFTLVQEASDFADEDPAVEDDDDRTAAIGRGSPRAAAHDAPYIEPEFPGRLFARDVVPMAELRASGKLAGESAYLAVGGGIGSFVWVDHLRIFGVPEEQIRVIGISDVCYEKWKEYCENSQIPSHERIRSNSISTPDNIWGFPGYALRESWRDLKNGKVQGLKHVLQVFGEPTLAESFTPRAEDVHASLDREQTRIGWSRMITFGRALSLRKTDDGRYVLAYKVPADHADGDRDRFWVGRFVHVATGYPTTRYLDDLQTFKRQNRGSNRVVNAYEHHEAVYRALAEKGGTVVVRGRGIVASRVIQRLWETRARNKQIGILHLMRGPVPQGTKFDLARRAVQFDVELQPFNWPKSCWGGHFRKMLEEASPEKRSELLSIWGGTTTAERSDWHDLMAAGTREGWYRIYFGEVKKMRLKNDKVVTEIVAKGQFNETLDLVADYVIDCTGLIADVTSSPFLKDVIARYNLPRNKASGAGPENRLAGITVTNQFEIKALRNGEGRVYAAGVVTQNGPYAAVDSFLGLQYAALRSVDHLHALKAPGLRRMGALQSAAQWLKWCAGARP
ncbi:FHA domain-containing protein [Prosthecomicrobium sp. N25]|uniref:FHA domain-containing protein n=1 Tax=Prosthecomicrobium sp. N25 TaxID=3129254 RepID=UPI0030785B28